MAFEQFDRIIGQTLEQCRQQIIDRHVAAGQVATGQTRDSFAVRKVADFHWQLVQVGPSAPAGTLDEGRAPGRVPRYFRKVIAAWAKAKGLVFSSVQEANRFAYFAAKKIAAEGTERHRHPVDVVRTPVEACKQKLRDEVGLFFPQRIKQTIFKNDL